jgi:hypothetical protein
MDDRTFHDLVDAIERGEPVPDDLAADEAARLAVARQLFAARTALPAALRNRSWQEDPATPGDCSPAQAPRSGHRTARRNWPVRSGSWLPELALLTLIALLALLTIWGAGRHVIMPGGSATAAPAAGPRGTATTMPAAEGRIVTPASDGTIAATDALTDTTATLQAPADPSAIFWALTVAGKRAYGGIDGEGGSDGAYSRLEVLDVSDPTAPRRLGETALTTSAPGSDIAIAGSTAYVAAGGLRVVDVSDPAQPKEVGVVTMEDTTAYPPPRVNWPAFIAVRGDRVYGANRRGGVAIFDVAQPTHPRLVGEIGLPDDGQAHDVAVQGDVLLAVDGGGGLFTYGLADPDQPRLLGTVRATAADPLTWSNLAIVADRAVVVTSTEGGGVVEAGPDGIGRSTEPGQAQRLEVFDIGDPTQPKRLASTDLAWPVWSLAVQGNRLIAASADGRFETFLSAVDATEQAAPTQIARLPGQVYAMAAAGSYLLVAGTGHSGLKVLNFADPTHPTWLAQPTPEPVQPPPATP